jgi:hypothetical protein
MRHPGRRGRRRGEAEPTPTSPDSSPARAWTLDIPTGLAPRALRDIRAGQATCRFTVAGCRDRAQRRGRGLLLGLVDLAAGVIALAWPGPTALVLVLIVGIWTITAGVVEIAAAFATGEPAGTRALFILAGLISIAFGVVLCARPASARSPWRCCSACST